MATTNNREIWLPEFQRKLYEIKRFYTGAKSDGALAENYKTINIPQSLGLTATTVFTDASGEFPITPIEAETDILAYDLGMSYLTPNFMNPLDKTEFSFDFMKQNLQEGLDHLSADIEKAIGYAWTADGSSDIKLTTGSARTNKFANASAKAITYVDIIGLGKVLDLQNVPDNGRRLLVGSSAFADLLTIQSASGLNLFRPTYDALVKGKVGEILGFDVYKTNYTASFNVGGSKKAVDASDLATDVETTVAYHPSFVRYAISRVFSNTIKGGAYLSEDDITVAWVRYGASPSRKAISNTTTGIVTLKEAV